MPLIRPETPGDAAAIRAVIEAAFRQAEHTDGNEGALVDALRAADALPISLVADRDGQIIGHIAASAVTLAGSAGWFGIAPVAVLPGSQGGGVGAALMHTAIGHLREQGAQGAVLIGDPGFYARFGFSAQDGLCVPGIPGSYVMGLPFGTAPATGRIAYHAAFGLPD